MVDKNNAMTEYLMTCPVVRANPLFFNFARAENNNSQILTNANDIQLQQTFIDGSKLKKLKFTMLIYKSISYNAVVKISGYPDENMSDLAECQAFIDWVVEQNENRIFPDFGNDCIIEEVGVLSENPVVFDIEEGATPPIATYSMTIEVTYLDKSKQIWNK